MQRRKQISLTTASKFAPLCKAAVWKPKPKTSYTVFLKYFSATWPFKKSLWHLTKVIAFQRNILRAEHRLQFEFLSYYSTRSLEAERQRLDAKADVSLAKLHEANLVFFALQHTLLIRRSVSVWVRGLTIPCETLFHYNNRKCLK